ncbi:MAG: GNAT family N-acetyltransferase [Ilumatobacteraceae bacterium]|nr:GNAT family N-acetyltransferase [Ilumatobacteraceae bacterium]
MRVLWVVKGLGPGGAERLLVAAASVHAEDRFDIECAYVLPWKDHLAGELESAGVKTHCLSKRRSDPLWPINLARLIRSGNFDVVHIHSPLPGSVARIAARTMRAANRPALISTEHNRWETHRLPTRFANRLTSRWDAASFAVTDEVRDSLSGPAAAHAVTLRHGINLEQVSAEVQHRGEIREELGLTVDDFVVGTVANFRPQKDYPNLLGAIRLLADRDVPVRVVAVGQGPQEEEIRALAHELGLRNRLILTGFRADAVRVMAACDAFVLASKWEGLPVAVMEALALGLPIVASNVGGMAEELTDGIDALLVPPGDSGALAVAIERVVTDESLCNKLGKASLGRAPEFGAARAEGEIEAAYERVASPSEVQSAPAPTRPRRTVAVETEIREAQPEDRDAIINLLRRSLGSDGDQRYPELFAWKHDHNRFGPSPMWVATDNDRVVAFRALMRWEFLRGGQVLRAVRAVDTATDPDYQGQGLFRRLTMHGLEAVHADGVDFVFNTPNSQSLPGYLKMGWREVGQLPAAVRFAGPGGAVQAVCSREPANRWSTELDLGSQVLDWLAAEGVAGRSVLPADVREIATNTDADYLAWRFGTPLLGYRVVDDGDSAVIVRARMRGTAKELAVVAEFGDLNGAQRLAAKTASEAGCSYAIRIGRRNLLTGYLGLPGGGPTLTWRAVNDQGFPPLANWALSLGDIELF